MMGLVPDLCSADWRTSQCNPTKTIMSALKRSADVRLGESADRSRSAHSNNPAFCDTSTKCDGNPVSGEHVCHKI